jgi:transcriptional regulator with XRE-family HTH domain
MTNKIGSRIRSAREARGMSAAELARLVKVSQTAVWNWEEKNRKPHSQTLTALAKVLAVSPEHLLHGNGTSTMGVMKPKETVADVVEEARSRIATLTGFAPEKIKLKVEFVDRESVS